MTTTSRDPRTGATAEGPATSTPEQVAAVIHAAAACADELAATAPAERRRWLAGVADALDGSAVRLVDLADAETALGTARLAGELGKAAAQARFYGDVAAEGSWVGASLDRVAGPPPLDLRRVRLPVGPVAVFGASNFPFAFGVAGHDTMSALAAGCPVLVKAHPAHPRLSALLRRIVTGALADAGAPVGAFAVVVGFEAGLALVDSPDVRTVAFTGSQAGGIALVERAAARPDPIPVFAEMGTVNPAIMTPAAGRLTVTEQAAGFVGSFTLGFGQFCTKPGLLLAPRGSGVPAAVAAALASVPAGWLLTEGIASAYREGVAALIAAGARHGGSGARQEDGFAGTPAVLAADIADLVPGSRLLQECFGPVALLVEYDDEAQLRTAIGRLAPSLAASVLTAGSGDPDTPWLVSLLATRVGRVIVDGWPTGVVTSWAQHHGGPWPATSRHDATSVGAGALDRFTRPVAFQGVPEAALPPALRADNPWGLPRRVDGALGVALGRRP